MLADLAAAAEEEAPAPSAGLGDIVDAPANSEPEPVAVAAVSVVEPTPSRLPLFAKLLRPLGRKHGAARQQILILPLKQ